MTDWPATNAEVVSPPRPSGPQTRLSGHKKRLASDTWNLAIDSIGLLCLDAGIAFWVTGSVAARADSNVIPVWTPLLGLLAIVWLASRRHISRRLPVTVAAQEIALACAAGAIADSWLRGQAAESATLP